MGGWHQHSGADGKYDKGWVGAFGRESDPIYAKRLRRSLASRTTERVQIDTAVDPHTHPHKTWYTRTSNAVYTCSSRIFRDKLDETL